MARNERNKTLEDIVIAFRNFSGKEDMYNRAGDRNFAIILEEQVAQEMEQDGWNVKYLREREEGDGRQPYIQVAVSYKSRPPKIGMVTSKGLTYLSEDEVEVLDWVDIETADVILNPYEWAVGDKHGVKAYVKSLFIKIEEDYLQAKWTAFVEDNKKQVHELESARPMIIDGEYELH